MENRKTIYVWHRNPELSALCHLGGMLLGLLLIIIYFNAEKHIVVLISAIIIMLLSFSSFFYAYFWSWNTIICFDDEKVFQKIKGKRYEWRWAEITDCRFRMPRRIFGIRPLIPSLVEFTTISEYKKLTFSFSLRRKKKFLEFCPNQKVKELFQKAYDDNWENDH